MSELEGRVVAITGGASGLGMATARKATTLGARVAVIDLDPAAAQALADSLPGARAYGADVGDLAQMQATYAAIVSDFGKLDSAVNSAGIIGTFAPVGDYEPTSWDLVLRVNLTGMFNSLKSQIPYIAAVGGGAIVNMASMAGVLAEEAMPAYVASKHGVVGLTKSVALDYGASGIRCNAICPSFVRTAMNEMAFQDPAFVAKVKALTPIGRAVTADEVASIACFLLGSGSSGMTGSVHLADGGLAVR